jgi:hypothetical protein
MDINVAIGGHNVKRLLGPRTAYIDNADRKMSVIGLIKKLPREESKGGFASVHFFFHNPTKKNGQRSTVMRSNFTLVGC